MPPRRSRLTHQPLAVFLSVGMLSILPLLSLEQGLRLASVGLPTGPLIASPHDPDYLQINRDFAQVYFKPGLGRTLTTGYIRREKRPETVRIFVLGGSAALGYPDARTNFSRKLAALLRRAFPTLEIEVVNFGTAAVNSHFAWEVAQHAVDYQPDLFLVYLGNNEVIGPFGPVQQPTISVEDPRAIRAVIAARRLRIAQLLTQWMAGSDKSRWRGMQEYIQEPILETDPRLEYVYSNFRQNLEDIRELALDSGAGILFGSVVSNLADFEPFDSAHRADLDDSGLELWRRHFELGTRLLTQGSYRDAVEELEAATLVDDQHAETHYRLGQARHALGQTRLARAAFVRARDLDTIRFRADSSINQIIREVASQGPALRVGFVDAVGATPEELTGSELLLEHVHFSSEGNDWLARTFYGPVSEIIARERGLRAEPVDLSVDALSEAIFDFPSVRVAALEGLMKLIIRPPFSGRSENDVLIARLEARIEGLRQAPFDLNGALMRSLESEPDNFVNHLLAQRMLSWQIEAASHSGDVEAFDRAMASSSKLLAIRGDNGDINAERVRWSGIVSDFAAQYGPVERRPPVASPPVIAADVPTPRAETDQ